MDGAIPPFLLNAFMTCSRANLSIHRLMTPSVTPDYTRRLTNNELEQMVMEAAVY